MVTQNTGTLNRRFWRNPRFLFDCLLVTSPVFGEIRSFFLKVTLSLIGLPVLGEIRFFYCFLKKPKVFFKKKKKKSHSLVDCLLGTSVSPMLSANPVYARATIQVFMFYFRRA